MLNKINAAGPQKRSWRGRFLFHCWLALPLCLAMEARAQSTAFNFQGRLTDHEVPASGSYDLQLRLYDTASAGTGNQIGTTINLPAVPVRNGVFTVTPDFGLNAFPGADRFLEVGVKAAGSGTAFIILDPRQPISPTPYAIRSTSAVTADSATNATNAVNATNASNAANATTANSATTAANATQLGGQPAGNYVQTSDARLTDARAPTAGSANYIQNTTTPQGGANLNITGTATIGSALAANSGSIAGQLSVGGGASPQHELSIAGGPSWTTTNWKGEIDLQDGGAIGWGRDAGGLSFGIAQGFGGLNFFRSASKPGDTASPTTVDVVITDAGDVGIGGNGSAPTGARFQSNASGDRDGVAGSSTSVVRSGVYGYGPGYGVSGYSYDPGGTGVLGVGDTGVIASSGKIALQTHGTSWFQGNTTPLPATAGVGVAIGADSANFGYIFAFDYTNFVPKVLALNGPGGKVGIGTTAPDQTLSVNGNASKAGGGSWLTFSDERLKNLKGRFTPGLKEVMQLEPIRYEYKQDNALELRSDGEHVGFGAQAVEKVIPEAVTHDSNGYRLVNNDPIMWTMLNGIKEQQSEIQAQQKEIEQLKAEMKRLRANGRHGK